MISSLWCYLLGNLMFLLFYDKKYKKSRYFTSNKYHGVTMIGWKWATIDGLNRIFLRSNVGVPWPVSSRVHVSNSQNIKFDPDDLNNFQTLGTYFQGIGEIVIGKGTWIAPNVGLITANHDINDLNKHQPPKKIIIGKACWIGMNSVVLPGVVLGDHTIVGAGSVVTKSFPNGNCIIAGNPAEIIRFLKE